MVAEAIELKPLMDPTSEHSVEPQSIVFDYDLDEDYTQRPPGSSTSRNETNSKVSVATASPLSGWPAARNFYKRNEGFMLIGLSQLFFASINTLVKLLQIKVEIPVWEVIWVRMSVTGVGAVYCKIILLESGRYTDALYSQIWFIQVLNILIGVLLEFVSSYV